MKRLLAIIFLLIFVGVGSVQAQPFPPNPTVGQEVTGSDGQIYVWDGVKWVRKIPGPWAPETKTSVTAPANPTAGQLWFDPINLQTYIWYTDPTSSQWVAIVNGAGGGGGPSGGPFLPEDNPTFTGLLTGPTEALSMESGLPDLTMGGAATAPMAMLRGYNIVGGGSDWTAGGVVTATSWIATLPEAEHISLAGGSISFAINTGLTVGEAFGPQPVALLSANGLNLTPNQDSSVGLGVLNSSAGGNAQARITVTNGVTSANLDQSGTAYTGNPAIASNTTVLGSTGTNGLDLIEFADAPIRFWRNGWAALIEPGAIVLPNTNYSQIQFGTYEAPVASILGYVAGSLQLTANAWWNGGQWTMPATGTAEQIVMHNNAYVPNIDVTVQTYTGGPSAINWQNIARFEDQGDAITGLNLPGFANRINYGGAARAGLTIGNSYLSSINWANLSISGASFPIGGGTGWKADCGAGGGMALFQVGPGMALHMYTKTPTTCSAGFAWSNIANWNFGGMTVNHIENLDEEPDATTNNRPTESPVPSVTSGALVKGSRDMFGWIRDVKGGQTTLTFTQKFDGESNCTLTDAGQPNLWFNANQTTGQVTFACVVPWTGEPCADGAWVEYHCFGQGG